MADLAAVWDGTVEIDWSDSGLFDHAASDVTEALRGLRFRWGAAERSNPERPVVDFGGGSLRLVGERYILGLSAVLSAAQLQRRHLLRVSVPGWAPILGRCSLDVRRSTADRVSQFVLEGLGREDVSAELDVVQPTEGVLSDSVEFGAWVEAHVGLVVPIRAAVRAYDRFRFEGRRGELVSTLAVTLAAMPVAGRGGSLRLRDPTMPTAAPVVLGSGVLAVAAASSRLDVAHVRNQVNTVLDVPATHTGVATVTVDAPDPAGSSARVVGEAAVWDGGGLVTTAVIDSVDSVERLVPDEIESSSAGSHLNEWLLTVRTSDTETLRRLHDDYGGTDSLGALPSGLSEPTGLAFGDGRWLAVDDAGDELWRINPDDPGDTTGVYGLVGVLPLGLSEPTGLAFGDGRWLVVDDSGDELWRLNPDDPGDTTGVYGLVGVLPSGLSAPTALAFGDGRWLAADRNADFDNDLWRINPDDPGDTTGVYGLVGALPTAGFSYNTIAYGDGVWLALAISPFEAAFDVWRINPDDPGDTTGAYGLVGTDAGAVPFRALALAYAAADWRVASYRWQSQTLDADGETTLAAGAEPSGSDSVRITVDVRDNVLTTEAFAMRWTPSGGTEQTADYTPRGWADRSAADATTDATPGRASLAYVYGLRANLTLTFGVTVPVHIEDTDSVAAWGPRPLPLPEWLRYTDLASIEAALQPLVEALGQPRHLHTIVFAVPQTTPALTAVLDIEPGDYHRLDIADARLPTAINAVAMVLAAQLDVTAAQQASLQLVFIESAGETSAPSNLAATGGRAFLDLTWDAPIGTPDRYDIEWGLDDTHSGGAATSGTNSYRITGLAPATTYHVRVRAAYAR